MVLSLIAYTALDLGTKEWALENLSRERQGDKPPICQPDAQGRIRYQRIPLEATPWIDGVLRLSYAENCGAAFSMLRSAPLWLRALVFGVTTLVACIVLSVMFVRGAGGALFAQAVPLILSGALGNLSDRVRHGFVVDFFQVDPQLFSYPIFNVADIAIFIGVALILIDGMVKPHARPASLPQAADGAS
jgi:signal peptidase II